MVLAWGYVENEANEQRGPYRIVRPSCLSMALMIHDCNYGYLGKRTPTQRSPPLHLHPCGIAWGPFYKMLAGALKL